MIELEGIDKSYGQGQMRTQVLSGVGFRIEAGEYVSIMGASGTGKSTLMNIIGCLDKPTDGHYHLDGVDMVNLDDDALSHVRNERLGFVFQQFHLLDRTTALRNVMLPLIYGESYPENARERAAKALDAVGLADRKRFRRSELSGGQQQRVAIARALVTDPQIILADEPTGNLDRKSGLEVLAIFKQLHRDGRTVVVVTHDAAIAEHANRIIVLRNGAVAEDRAVGQPRDARAELDSIKSDCVMEEEQAQ
jgi:putative ABC transport system ATP-binding protein